MQKQFVEPSTLVRDYRIGDVLGIGGFSITYEAYHVHLAKHFAVKEYFPASVAQRQVDGSVAPIAKDGNEERFSRGLDRFLREARTLEAINHPNVVKVRDVFVHGGTGYMVMDFIDGETIESAVLRSGPVPAPALRSWLEHLSDGLSHVHDAGFLHRDIKPSNIIIRAGDGSPVLIDFGAAKTMEARTSATTQFVSHGYSPIEINATRLESGPWTDLYSLCAVAWFATMGKAPPDAMAERFSAESEPLKRLSALGGPWVQLFSAIDAGLALYPKDRPQDLVEWRSLFLGTATQLVEPVVQAIAPAGAEAGPQLRQSSVSAGPPNSLPIPAHESAELPIQGDTSVICAGLAAALISGLFFGARLADPAAEYGWRGLICLIALSAAILGGSYYALNRLFVFATLGRERPPLPAIIAYMLFAPVIAMALLLLSLIALTSTASAKNLHGDLVTALFGILDLSDKLSGVDLFMVLGLLVLPFAVIPAAYVWRTMGKERQSYLSWGMFLTLCLCGFALPFFEINEDLALKRLGNSGYFVFADYGYNTDANTYRLDAVAEFNRQAVLTYQQDNALAETGIIDGPTWRSLLWDWPSRNYRLDSSKGHTAFHLILAGNRCRPSCKIDLGPGTYDIAAGHAEFNRRFLVDSTSLFDGYWGLGIGDAELVGEGNDTVLANVTLNLQGNHDIRNLRIANGSINADSGGHLSNVTVDAPMDRSALTASTLQNDSRLELERVNLAATGSLPALDMRAAPPEQAASGERPVISLTDVRIVQNGQSRTPALRVSGPISLSMSGGSLSTVIGMAAEVTDGATAKFENVDGACVNATAEARVTIASSNLLRCGAGNAVARADSNAVIDIEGETALPSLPDQQRFERRAGVINIH